MPGRIYELRVTLAGSRPPIWRRVAVPAEITLGQLHDVIQVAMGWTDCHLHLFVLPPQSTARPMTIGIDAWSEPQTFGPPGDDMDGMEAQNEDKAILSDLLPDVKCKLEYIYDMGDGWEHTIEVKKIYDDKPDVAYPVCLAGKKACPPDDCGGIWGYYEMLEALADLQHERHEELIEWIGAFDPDALDLDETNALLSRR